MGITKAEPNHEAGRASQWIWKAGWKRGCHECIARFSKVSQYNNIAVFSISASELAIKSYEQLDSTWIAERTNPVLGKVAILIGEASNSTQGSMLWKTQVTDISLVRLSWCLVAPILLWVIKTTPKRLEVCSVDVDVIIVAWLLFCPLGRALCMHAHEIFMARRNRYEDLVTGCRPRVPFGISAEHSLCIRYHKH